MAKRIMPADHVANSDTEDAHQKAIFCWAAQSKNPLFTRLLFAVPNGGERDIITASKMRATGTKPGVADIILLVPRGKFHGLALELKRPVHKPKHISSSGGLSDAQIAFKNDVQEQGYAWAVAYGWEEAVHYIERYMGLPAFSFDDARR
jgi:hypothetical protein